MNYLLTIEQEFNDETILPVHKSQTVPTLYAALEWFSDITTELGITDDMIEIEQLNQWVTVQLAEQSYRYLLQMDVVLEDGSIRPFKSTDLPTHQDSN